MSNNNNHHDDSVVPGSSTSNDSITGLTTPQINTTIPQTTQNEVRNIYLDVPTFRALPRRLSLDSTFSDLSELSYHSHDFHNTLMPKLSNTSHYSTTSISDSSSRSRTWRSKLHSVYVQNYGALLVLASQLFGSGMNVATRLLEQPGPHGPPMHPFQILFARQSLTALFCTVYALTTKSIPHFPLGPPDRGLRPLLVVRGLTGFFGVFGLYFSLLYLPLSEATVLTFLAPILTCYLCSLLIPGQIFSRQQQIAGLVSLVGVVFIARPLGWFMHDGTPATGVQSGSPGGIGNATTAVGNTGNGVEGSPTVPTPSQHLLAIGIAMIGVCGATGAMTSIRAIGTRVHAFITVNYFSVMSSIVSLLALLIFPSVSFRLPGNLQEWALLLSLGVCGFCLQSLLTMGLAYGGPATAAVQEVTREEVVIAKVGEDIEMQSQSQSQNQAGPSEVLKQATRRRDGRVKPIQKISSGSGTRATSMVYTQMLFALSADRIFFGSVPDVWSWIGSGLILAGAIWVAAARDGSKATADKAVIIEEVGTGEAGSGLAVGLQRVKSRGEHAVVGDGMGKEEEQVGLLTDEAVGGEDDDDDDDGGDDRLRR